MKKIIILLIISVPVFAFAQMPSIQWKKSYGGSNTESGEEIIQTSDGGYLFISTSSSSDGDISINNKGFGDFWLVKLDYLGNIQWEKSIGGSMVDSGHSIQQTTDGGFILLGTSTSTNGDINPSPCSAGAGVFYTIKFDYLGNIQWKKALVLGTGYSIRQTADGGYVAIGMNDTYVFCAGGTPTNNHGSYDLTVVKTNSLGSVQWQKCYGGSQVDIGYSIEQTRDGGFIAIGHTNSFNGDVIGNHGNVDYLVLKIDSLGAIQWQKCYGGTGDDKGYSIRQTLDGGYIANGYSNSNNGDVIGNHGNEDYLLLKLDSLGTIQWQKCIGSTGNDRGFAVRQTSDSGYVLIGKVSSYDGDVNCISGDGDYSVFKLNKLGAIQWQKCLGAFGVNLRRYIEQTSDGGYIISGTATSLNLTDNHGGYDAWVAKLGPTVGVEEYQNINQLSVFSNQNNNTFTFHNIYENSNIEIYDTSGKLILMDKSHSENYILDLKNNAPGIYFYKIIDKQNRVFKGKLFKQ